jgi:AraC-like DNA-binding protein
MTLETGQQDARLSSLPPGLEMVRRAPISQLQGIVTDICGYRDTSPSRNVEYASLTIPLVISFAEPFAIGLGRSPNDNDRFGSFAAGLYAGPVVIESRGAACCVQINFTPLGARRFFGLPMSELTDRMVGLDDVLGHQGERLREQLGNAPDWSRRFDIIQGFVTARLAATARTQTEIAWAFDRIVASGGRARVASVARELGWSRKHLAGRFSDAIGAGPKTLSRIVRFNRALGLSRLGVSGWADIAADCGYSDQAHLVREFRDLAGETPGMLAART